MKNVKMTIPRDDKDIREEETKERLKGNFFESKDIKRENLESCICSEDEKMRN